MPMCTDFAHLASLLDLHKQERQARAKQERREVSRDINYGSQNNSVSSLKFNVRLYWHLVRCISNGAA